MNRSLQSRVKRSIDLLFALLILGPGLPLLLLIGLVILMTQGLPVLFSQHRPGLQGKIFALFKFRTMTIQKSETGELLPDSQRLTRFGRWLRSTSLDELPSFFNVLKGEMSVVGPRPLLVKYLERYTPEQARRHDVKPGVTGWAQVNGRNARSWDEKFPFDTWYVDNWSLGLDCKILWRTVSKVLNRTGISAEGHDTMPEFKGASAAVSQESHPEDNES